MLLPILALAVAFSVQRGGSEPCDFGPACDHRDAERVADPNDYKGAHALTNMQEVFSTDHYPVEALREKKQGRVKVRVQVSPEGRPVACTVASSSRVPSLDRVTCARLMEAGRFKVAHNGSGQTKAYKTSIQVAWVLPSFDPFGDRVLRTVVPIDGVGTAGQCRVEATVPNGMSSPQSCPVQLIELGRKVITGAPSVDVIANRELVLEEGVLIGDASQFDTIGRRQGEQLLAATGLTLTVDAAGKVQSCEVIDSSRGPAEFAADMCKLHRKRRFAPLPEKDSNRQARSAIYYFANYLRTPPATSAN